LWKLSHDSNHELAVHLKLLHHSCHIVWRGWIVGTTATTTTTWSNHPAKDLTRGGLVKTTGSV
jgi:hypothetical protein